jgi:bifunctional DNA-binding transcriptional regulator/antitoxin component of YhaV-PrlF toxin-antitoxin module
MQAVITAEFLDNIPAPIRQRLNLKAGEVMDFDEQVPYLKAVPAQPLSISELAEFQSWVTSSIGLAKGKFTTDERMSETRGED